MLLNYSTCLSLFGLTFQVHMPIDRNSKKPKGFAYILYHISEHAVKAYIELDNKFFMGRLLHIIPSREKPNKKDEYAHMTHKQKKEMKQKEMAAKDFNWSSLYMNVGVIKVADGFIKKGI